MGFGSVDGFGIGTFRILWTDLLSSPFSQFLSWCQAGDTVFL